MSPFNKVLIIGKVWPEPKSSAAGVRMMQLLTFFSSSDIHITFASPANQSEFQANLELLKVDCVSIELNNDSFDEFTKELQPDLVIFDRFTTEEQFGWRVAMNNPLAVRILNTEDLHFLRDSRREAIKVGSNIDDSTIRTQVAMREIASIQRCDLSLFVSSFEISLLKNHYSISENRLQYLTIHSKKIANIPAFKERSDFMFIGTFYHEPNWDAVKILTKEIWPLIRQKLPNATLSIYGAYASQKIEDLHNESQGFLVKGRVEDSLEVTKQVKVSLSPLRFGAGIKGKHLEAMQCGTPVVTTEVGAEGMRVNDKWNGYIEDDYKHFAAKAILLHEDVSEWEIAQNKGFDILDSKHNMIDFDRTFLECLNGLKKTYEKIRKSSLEYNLFNYHSMKSSMYLSKWITEKNKTTH